MSDIKRWTSIDILALQPCYTAQQVHAVFAGRASLTLREMLATDIPVADKQWLVFRPGVLSFEQIDRLFVLFQERGVCTDAYAHARAYAYARAYAHARARAYAYARAYAHARAYAYARACTLAYAHARAYALQAQIIDVLTILTEDGQ